MTDQFRIRVRQKAALAAPTAPPQVATGAEILPPRVGAEYMRGGRGIMFAGWRPIAREPQTDIQMSWDLAANRATDMIHNSGWISGMVDQATADTVGTGLRLRSMPDAKALGITEDAASELADIIEQRHALWASRPDECDIEGRRTFGQMQAAGFKSWLATGEIFGELPFRRRPGNRYGTKVRLVPSHRLSRKTVYEDNLISGVRMDADGYPTAYVVHKRDLLSSYTEHEVPARDAYGRPRVIHAFDSAIGAVRGITPLVSALQVCRQFDQLADATLMAALVQSVFAASITSTDPTEETLAGLLTPQEQARLASQGISPYDAWFEAQAGWYDRAVLNVGMNGRVTHLFPGQKMEFHTSAHPNSGYKDFSLHLLREIARCFGLTYESATGDYEKATYSSVRMAVNAIFGITLYRRKNIVAPFCQAAYEAWLEEEIEIGGVDFPGGIEGFLSNRAAACRAEWIGAPKPQADDLKTARASETYRGMGVITDQAIANDLGMEIEDVYRDRAREKKLRDRYGLADPVPVPGVAGNADGGDPPDDAEDASSDQTKKGPANG